MDNTESVVFKINETTENYDITLNIPAESLLNRHVFFPDFGVEIGNEEPYSETTTQEYILGTYDEGQEIAREFLKIYPEAANGSTAENTIQHIAELFVQSWKEGKNLDLRHYNGIRKHS